MGGQVEPEGGQLRQQGPAASDADAQVVGDVAASPRGHLREPIGDAPLVEDEEGVTGHPIWAAEVVVRRGHVLRGLSRVRVRGAVRADRWRPHRRRRRGHADDLSPGVAPSDRGRGAGAGASASPSRPARADPETRLTASAMPATCPTVVTACRPNSRKNARRAASWAGTAPAHSRLRAVAGRLGANGWRRITTWRWDLLARVNDQDQVLVSS